MFTENAMSATLTLLELNQLVAEAIATVLPDEYWVEAELSELREVRGHCYMELVQKDASGNTPVARASAKCWRNVWQYIRPKFEMVTGQQLRPGLKVLLKVYAQFHEAYGFSWIVSDINPQFTMGEMMRRRHEIIERLKAEGVFDMQRGLSLPLFAQHVAVISNEGAAGYGDFCDQLARNTQGYAFRVSLFPAVLQGERVEQTVIEALEAINRQLDDFDVVVIIRGGGATSDLSGFDTLALAENVANFPLPIITGIGHERDDTVLDMVSFKRVKTPTAAAAFLIEHLAETDRHICDMQERMGKMIRQRMEYEILRLNRTVEAIPLQTSLLLARKSAQAEALFMRMANGLWEYTANGIRLLDMLENRLGQAVTNRMVKETHRLDLLEQRMKTVDPALLLSKGYSITLHNGRVVKDIRQLKSGDRIETVLDNGKIASIIE